MHKFFLALCASILLVFSNCTKDKTVAPIEQLKGQVKLKFDPIVNNKKLVLNDYKYSNTSGETFSISLFKFYISNIVFYNANDETVTIPKKDSFFLIDVADPSSLQPILNIPEGDYTKVEFNLGVDSITNTLPIEERTGVLDISKYDMYWTWNSGYIHLKLEGTSPAAQQTLGQFKYHIGFYGGYTTPTVNNNKKIIIDLTAAGVSQVRPNLSSDIHIMVDAGKIFDGKNNISIKETPVVMTSGPHIEIAENYSSMFTHDHTHNFQKIGI